MAEKSKMCKKSDRNSKLQYNGMEKGVSTIYFKNLKNSSLCKSNSTGKSHKYNKVIIFNVLVNSYKFLGEELIKTKWTKGISHL